MVYILETEKFRLEIDNSLDNIPVISHIFVHQDYRDQGLAKRIIYSVFDKYSVVIIKNIISPIIESIIKKYYRFISHGNTYTIFGTIEGYYERLIKLSF